ncbi:MAG: phosphatase PAP2 family protein [Acidimicrobiales bacterium]
MTTTKAPVDDARPPLARGVEALGGTLPGTRRRLVSPLRFVLPPAVGRRISAFDRAADAGFDHLRGRPAIDRVFYSASALADFSLLWHLVGTTRASLNPSREREAMRLSVALLADSVVVNAGIKSLFRRTRPPRQEHRRHRLRRPRSSSFPSGHATSAFMAATLLSSGNWKGPFGRMGGWHAIAAVVAASRVHVGIHHASDVIVGALVGTAFGRLVLWAWPVAPELEEVALSDGSALTG